MQHKKHYWLYVLKLEQGKYYVGITAKTPEKRFQEHKNGYMGAQWTKKYKPISIFDRKDLGFTTEERAEKYENKVVRTYMNRKGFNNVRGGDVSSPGTYIKRFGYYHDKSIWDNTMVGLLGLLIIVAAIIFILIYSLR